MKFFLFTLFFNLIFYLNGKSQDCNFHRNYLFDTVWIDNPAHSLDTFYDSIIKDSLIEGVTLGSSHKNYHVPVFYDTISTVFLVSDTQKVIGEEYEYVPGTDSMFEAKAIYASNDGAPHLIKGYILIQRNFYTFNIRVKDENFNPIPLSTLIWQSSTPVNIPDFWGGGPPDYNLPEIREENFLN